MRILKIYLFIYVRAKNELGWEAKLNLKDMCTGKNKNKRILNDRKSSCKNKM